MTLPVHPETPSPAKLRIAIFGQAAFGRDVTERLSAAGHEIVGIWAPPEGKRPDPLVTLAEDRGWPLFRHRYLRHKGQAIPEILEAYRSLKVDLNVLPFTTTILPAEIAHHPKHGSVCFHPSLLPAFRGGAALSWQIIHGAVETGVSVFKIDKDIDGGPTLIQRSGVSISCNDTMASLYFDKLYPLGVEAMFDAVQAIADGSASFSPQPSNNASFQGLIDDRVARINWNCPAVEIDRLIRGCDPAPGAIASLDGEDVRFFGGGLVAEDCNSLPGTLLNIREGALEIAASPGIVRVERLRMNGSPKLAATDAGLSPGIRFT